MKHFCYFFGNYGEIWINVKNAYCYQKPTYCGLKRNTCKTIIYKKAEMLNIKKDDEYNDSDCPKVEGSLFKIDPLNPRLRIVPLKNNPNKIGCFYILFTFQQHCWY